MLFVMNPSRVIKLTFKQKDLEKDGDFFLYDIKITINKGTIYIHNLFNSKLITIPEGRESISVYIFKNKLYETRLDIVKKTKKDFYIFLFCIIPSAFILLTLLVKSSTFTY